MFENPDNWSITNTVVTNHVSRNQFSLFSEFSGELRLQARALVCLIGLIKLVTTRCSNCLPSDLGHTWRILQRLIADESVEMMLVRGGDDWPSSVPASRFVSLELSGFNERVVPIWPDTPIGINGKTIC